MEVVALDTDRVKTALALFGISQGELARASGVKPVGREALEPALILMLNDPIRAAILTRAPEKATDRVSGGEASIVRGMDNFLAALRANGAITLDTIGDRQVIAPGPNAVEAGRFSDEDRTKAREAVQAVEKLEVSRAMSYLEETLHEQYELDLMKAAPRSSPPRIDESPVCGFDGCLSSTRLNRAGRSSARQSSGGD